MPDPVDLRKKTPQTDEPLFGEYVSTSNKRNLGIQIWEVHLPAPIIRIELDAETSCWSFDWANSEVVAIGTTGGKYLWIFVQVFATND